MKLRLVLVSVLVALIVTCASAQSITGKVVEAKTKAPVPFATVFLANTMIGTQADANGLFTLMKVPVGKYDLTVSSVGFQLLSQPLSVKENFSLEIQLQPEVKVFQEVTVKSSNREYLMWLRSFKKYFLGETLNAANTTIVNVDDINLGFADKVLTASCDKPIIVENRALGYRVYYLLQQFKLDLNMGLCTVGGVPRFEELQPKNPGEMKRWNRERNKAYYGSINHFMRALKYSCLTEEKFTVSMLKVLPKGVSMPGQIETIKDTAYYSVPVNESILRARPFTEHTFIRIVYNGERPEAKYAGGRGVYMSNETSTFKATKHGLIIHENGYYEDPLSYITDGYIAWSERIAELIPLEYHPGQALEEFLEEGKGDFSQTFLKNDTSDNIQHDLLGDSSQTPSGTKLSTLSGIVTDAKTNAPISAAEVYIANSLRHSTTDESGKYALPEIPIGRYDIVVAAANHSTGVDRIFLNGIKLKANWPLAPSTSSADLIKNSSDQVRIFSKYAFGRTRNSYKCEILNIQDVAFVFDHKQRTLFGYASKPLEILNRALGYKIYYSLDQFVFAYSSRTYIVEGKARLEELVPTNEKEKQLWAEARKSAYRGSLAHFMKSLQSRTLNQEKFSIYHITGEKEVQVDESFIFNFRADEPLELKVVYSGAKAQDSFLWQGKESSAQISTIKLTKDLLENYPNGYIQPPGNYGLAGYFSWTSVLAELLPSEYYLQVNQDK